MSFILNAGIDAMDEATATKTDASKALVSLKSGKVIKVRVPVKTVDGKLTPYSVVKYLCHSVFNVFYSTPCTKAMGKEDFYDKAVELLYADAKELENGGADEETVKAKKDEAYALKAKEKFLIGFINLEDGKPIVVDFSRNQAQTIIKSMKEYAEEAVDFGFKLSKTGEKRDTKVSLDIIVMPQKGLTENERTHLAASQEMEFDFTIFEQVLKPNDEIKQLKDIHDFGFDVMRLGISEEEFAKVLEHGKEKKTDGEAKKIEEGAANDTGF
jgi:hypothetical protein